MRGSAGAILGVEQPFHPIGQPFAEYKMEGFDTSIFTESTPSYAEVLDVRAGHVAMVRDYFATVTPDMPNETRPNPCSAEHDVTVLGCLRDPQRGWEHNRYAVRDLDAMRRRALA